MALHLRGIDKFIAETEQLNLIQRAVAHCYAVTPALLRFKGPDEKSQLARSVAIYLSRDILLTDLTILEGFFGCEPHESAAAHCNRVAERIALSRETAATIRNLKSYCVVLVVSDATTLAAVSQDKPDPRDPDHSRSGIFVHHNCYRCGSGEMPCVNGNPNQCEYPHARND